MEVQHYKLQVVHGLFLKPVAIYPDPTRINGYLVMTEVLNADGTVIHQMQERLLMTMIMIFGLDLSKNISLWILKPNCL